MEFVKKSNSPIFLIPLYCHYHEKVGIYLYFVTNLAHGSEVKQMAGLARLLTKSVLLSCF